MRPDEPRTEPKSVIRSSTHRPHTTSYPSLPKTNVVNFQPGVAQTDDQAGLPRQPSALDYSNYISKRYPKMVAHIAFFGIPFFLILTSHLISLIRHCTHFHSQSSQPLAVLLQEQNARAIRHVTMARHNIQNDMVIFTDKLMSALAASCTCCTTRGLLDCPL